jgi:fucose permease
MLILSAVLAIFVYGMIAAMLGTILPDLSARFHLTPKQNGTIALTQAMGLVIASISVGPLVDSQGVKTGMIIGLAVICAALALLPRSTGFGQIAAYLFLLGLGGGTIVTAANDLGTTISQGHSGTALNLLNLFFGLGGLATPFISANLLGGNSTRLCYLTALLSGGTLAVNAATAMPGPSGNQSAPLAGIGSLVGSPALWMLSLFLFLYVASEVGVWNWLVQHLIAQGIPESRALNILSLGFALGLLVGRVAVSPILISISGLTVTLVAAVLMLITTYLMLQTRSATTAGLLVFLAGVSMAPVFPTTLAITGTAFPQMTGTALGFVITFGWIGLAISSRIIGSVAGGEPTRLKKALLLLPAMAAVMILVNLALHGVLPAH